MLLSCVERADDFQGCIELHQFSCPVTLGASCTGLGMQGSAEQLLGVQVHEGGGERLHCRRRGRYES